MRNPIPNSVRAVLIGTWVGTLIFLENRRALRRVHRSKLGRGLRNFLIAAPAGMVMQSLEMPVALKLSGFAQRRHWGLVPQLRLPTFVAGVIAVLLLDYTLYWWHFLTHRVPGLWRFHQVHHLDREMDATTALRFHFGEITISVLFRAAQMLAIGPSPAAVAVWQVFLFLCILFHHSNVRLPLAWERALAHLIVTPRLHGIHHSIAISEVNSNWSSGFTVWDWIHGTFRTDAPQDSLTLGVPGLQNGGHDALGIALRLPFEHSVNPPDYDHCSVRQPLRALA